MLKKKQNKTKQIKTKQKQQQQQKQKQKKNNCFMEKKYYRFTAENTVKSKIYSMWWADWMPVFES